MLFNPIRGGMSFSKGCLCQDIKYLMKNILTQLLTYSTSILDKIIDIFQKLIFDLLSGRPFSLGCRAKERIF